MTETGRTHAGTVARRPFLRLEPEPRAALTDDVRGAVRMAEAFLGDQVPSLVQGLVHFAMATTARARRVARVAPTVTVINRRRRAATQWIGAILAGRIDRETLHAIGHTWIPQLAGSGPDLHRGLRRGRQCLEYLRGAFAARVFEHPADNLVPCAKAMWGLETVLAIHLDAYENAVAASESATPPS